MGPALQQSTRVACKWPYGIPEVVAGTGSLAAAWAVASEVAAASERPVAPAASAFLHTQPEAPRQIEPPEMNESLGQTPTLIGVHVASSYRSTSSEPHVTLYPSFLTLKADSDPRFVMSDPNCHQGPTLKPETLNSDSFLSREI